MIISACLYLLKYKRKHLHMRDRSFSKVLTTDHESGLSHWTLNRIQPNRVSGVLIGSPNSQRTRAHSYRILEHVGLTACFDFGLLDEQDSVHS